MQLGQHFMVDEELLNKIVDISSLDTKDCVLEIGSGKGALTKYLIKTPVRKIICVEKDESLKLNLAVELIHADILDVIDGLFFDVVVSNLPYYISEPLFHHFLRSKPKRIVVVVGKQFADKLLDTTIIGEVVRSVYDVSLIETIPPQAFVPPPSVESALIRLIIKKEVDFRYERFFELSKSKVKNYVLKIAEGRMNKRLVREKLAFLSEGLVEKPLYVLNRDEFLVLKEFLDSHIS